MRDALVSDIHFLNTGSVGRPRDGDSRAGYVFVDGHPTGNIAVEFIRVEYDLERVMDGIRRSDLPDDFVDSLRHGGQMPVTA